MKAKKPTKPNLEVSAKELSGVYQRIREILESARAGVARTVNTTQVVANWLIGRELVEEQQKGAKRADYGRALLSAISRKLRADFGTGYSVDNLEWFRNFYLGYPYLLNSAKSDAVRRNFTPLPLVDAAGQISETLRRKSGSTEILHAVRGKSISGDAKDDQPWRPGWLSPNLSWTHYRTLLRVDSPDGSL